MSEPIIPARHPRTCHLSPYWWNNSYAGILRGFVLRYKYFDQDNQCDKDGIFWGGHWAVPEQDGFTWVWTGKRNAVKKEIRVPDPNPGRVIRNRPTAEMEMLRRSKWGGGRYRKSWLHAQWISKRGGIMCFEAKGSPGFEDDANWARFRAQLTKHCPKATVYIMTLQDIPGWRKRCRAARRGGKFQTALLPRSAKPTDWSSLFGDEVTALWGSWR